MSPRRHGLAGALLSLLAAVPLGAQASSSPAACTPLPPALGAQVERAWAAYRAGDATAAEAAFGRVLAQCPDDAGALAGRGYAALRRNALDVAAASFDRVLRRTPNDYDALVGRGLVAWRRGDVVVARRAFEAVLAVKPGDATAREYLAKLPEVVDSTRLAPKVRPATTVVAARTGKRIFQVPDGRGGWKPLWVKAVNVGAALPGKHPSEFPPDDSTYDRWIALAASIHANALRVYTVHPPHFYRALRRWNLAHPNAPMWLIHGVWTELPPGDQEEKYDDPEWNGAFRAEMRNVVDLIHGRAAIAHRPGHASGMYDADVSRWTLAYITGREWEPYSVVAYAKAHPTQTRMRGRYVTVDSGNPVEVWMAEATEYLAGYEMQQWNAQRPIAYTNWPTLDPLHHPTESTLEQEDSIRTARGEVVPDKPREFDNDAIGLDATRMRATPAFPAGTFASFHAYPYYPDFMIYDPGYAKARSPWGPSHYYGYLRELVEHHGDMPVVISEYGVPSSRGTAHLQPEGWHHGGHDERGQAEVNARLTREIHAAGAAGAGLFAVIDEWFKKNWLVIDFEQPLERNRLWLNALDAEQNYGLIAMRAGVKDSAHVVDGDPRDWFGRAPWYDGRTRDARTAALPAPLRLRGLHVDQDEAYVHLRLDVDSIAWDRARYVIGIDTYDSTRGDHVLPYTGSRSAAGLEFVVDLNGPAGSHVLVDRPYKLYRRVSIVGARPATQMSVYNAPFQSIDNSLAQWDTMMVTTNRRRIGRDGTVFPEQLVDRNLLRYARQQETTLADWYADTARGVIEVRIPWGMLHVVDPSSRLVLHGHQGSRDPDGLATEGFRFVVESYDPRAPRAGGDRLPRQAGLPPLWTWRTWEAPRWWAEEKPLVAAMRDAFGGIP